MNSILFVAEHTRTYNVQWHQHDYWEMVYCTGGEGEFRFENGTIMPYKEGEAVAIPPHEPHANFSKDGFTNIHLTMADPAYPYKGAFRVSDDPDGHLKNAFVQAKYYYLADIKKRELVLDALGNLITSYLIVFRSNNDYSEPVERLRTEIMKQYSNPNFALDEAIRALPFHYDYLRKLFKKEVGVTPLEYLTNLRIKKAETLLTAMWSNEYSMSEIAEMCGFDDALYFSRVFKKHNGISPTGFAKARGKSIQAQGERAEQGREK